MPDEAFRLLTIQEKAILAKLLEAPLPALELIQKQVALSQVRTLDANGSLEFRVDSSSPRMSVEGALVTGSQADSDTIEGYGPYIQVILFSRSGSISHLDVYKDDGGEIKTAIDPDKFVITYGTPP
jgi:hypothetical protein